MITRSKLFLTILTVLFMTVLLAGTAFAQSVTLEVEPEGTVAEGEQVTLTATVDGAPEGVDLEYRFAYRKSGGTKIYTPQAGPSNSWTTTVPAGAAGEWDLGVQVRQAGTSGWSSPPVHDIVFGYVITEEEPPVGELEVVSVEAINSKNVVVNFNQPVDIVSGSNLANYSIEAGAGGNITILPAPAAVVLNEDRTAARLVLAQALPAAGDFITQAAVNYTVEVGIAAGGVQADDGESAIEDFAAVYSLRDNVRPTAGEVIVVDRNTIRVPFSEPVWESPAGTTMEDFVGVYNALDILQFGLGTAAGNIAYVENLNLQQNFAQINIAGLTPGDDYYVRVSGLSDYADNIINPNPTDLWFTVPVDTEDPEIESVEAIGYVGANAFLRVDFSETVLLDATAANEPFTLTVDGAPVVLTAVDPAAFAGATESYVIFSFPLAAPGLVRLDIAGDYADLSGNTGAARTFFRTFETSNPTPVSAEYVPTPGGNLIVIEFDVDVPAWVGLNPTDRAASYISDNTLFDLPAPGIAAGAQALWQNADDKWVMVIDADDYDTAGTPLPGGEYTMPLPAGYVEDWAGQSNLATDINFTVPDPGAAPTTVVAGATNQSGVNPNRVVVTYSRNVGASALNPSNYAIDGDNTVVESAIFLGNQQTVLLTLKDAAIAENNLVNFTVDNVVDANGNAVTPFADLYNWLNNARPYMVDADITSATTIDLTFNKALTVVTGGDPSMFTVRVDGAPVTVANVAQTPPNVVTVTTALPLTLNADIEIETRPAFDWHDGTLPPHNVARHGQVISAVWPAAAALWYE